MKLKSFFQIPYLAFRNIKESIYEGLSDLKVFKEGNSTLNSPTELYMSEKYAGSENTIMYQGTGRSRVKFSCTFEQKTKDFEFIFIVYFDGLLPKV